MDEFDSKIQQELNGPLTPEFRRRIGDVKRKHEFSYDRLADQARITRAFWATSSEIEQHGCPPCLSSSLPDVITRMEGTSGAAPVEVGSK